ncbi:MAG: hypothetical protein JFR24_06020 [Muribaculaceae bacterium]|jgi:predicted RNase H-like nuclease (RuvC/YqgF family)|nr:hypothetical protein [Muribaculaceae bacterium]MCI9117105.1 hypothetical protein [Muribaculaceae bacterium]
MAIDLQQQLERVNAKTTLVLEKYALMQQRLEQARAEIARLNDELRRSRQSIEALEMRLEYLSVSHTVASSGDELQRAKAMISELVREIDLCIADLND